MRIRSILILIAVIVVTPAGADTQDACGRSDDKLVDKSVGDQGNFRYESRVERIDERGNSLSGRAKLYIWCIENLNKYDIMRFQWGTADNPIKFFDKPVPPHKPTISKGTFFTDHDSDIRKIRTKRDWWLVSGLLSWETVDVQTIFYKEMPTKAPQKTERDTIRTSEADPSPPQGDIPDKIVELSQMKGGLSSYISKEGYIRLYFETTITLPANSDVARLLSKGEYKQYKAEDFVTGQVYLENIIKNLDKETVSVLKLTVSSEGSTEDLARARKALALNPISIDFATDDPTHRLLAPSLRVEKIDSIGQRFIFRKPAEKLLFSAFEMHILDAKTGTIFASLPVTVFVPSTTKKIKASARE
jgi:hypothetical protein